MCIATAPEAPETTTATEAPEASEETKAAVFRAGMVALYNRVKATEGPDLYGPRGCNTYGMAF